MFFLFEKCSKNLELIIKYNKYNKLYEDENDVYSIDCQEDYKDYNYSFVVSYKRKENFISYETNGDIYCFNVNELEGMFPSNRYLYTQLDSFPIFLRHQYDDFCENVIIKIKKIDKDNIFIKESREGIDITYYCSKSD